jgi:hypothetical protein
MELKIGTKIIYTSAAGTRYATIRDIKVGPTAKPGFLNTWLTLDIPAQKGAKFNSTVQIPADNGSLSAFQIQPEYNNALDLDRSSRI